MSVENLLLSAFSLTNMGGSACALMRLFGRVCLKTRRKTECGG
uniref:Uncharacterized protein n=1 Tax=Setaria italica TaxID=4555 RepID=K4APH9_SETIT